MQAAYVHFQCALFEDLDLRFRHDRAGGDIFLLKFLSLVAVDLVVQSSPQCRTPARAAASRPRFGVSPHCSGQSASPSLRPRGITSWRSGLKTGTLCHTRRVWGERPTS